MFSFTEKELQKVCQYVGLFDSGQIQSGLYKTKCVFAFSSLKPVYVCPVQHFSSPSWPIPQFLPGQRGLGVVLGFLSIQCLVCDCNCVHTRRVLYRRLWVQSEGFICRVLSPFLMSLIQSWRTSLHRSWQFSKELPTPKEFSPHSTVGKWKQKNLAVLWLILKLRNKYCDNKSNDHFAEGVMVGFNRAWESSTMSLQQFVTGNNILIFQKKNYILAIKKPGSESGSGSLLT